MSSFTISSFNIIVSDKQQVTISFKIYDDWQAVFYLCSCTLCSQAFSLGLFVPLVYLYHTILVCLGDFNVVMGAHEKTRLAPTVFLALNSAMPLTPMTSKILTHGTLSTLGLVNRVLLLSTAILTRLFALPIVWPPGIVSLEQPSPSITLTTILFYLVWIIWALLDLALSIFCLCGLLFQPSGLFSLTIGFPLFRSRVLSRFLKQDSRIGTKLVSMILRCKLTLVWLVYKKFKTKFLMKGLPRTFSRGSFYSSKC